MKKLSKLKCYEIEIKLTATGKNEDEAIRQFRKKVQAIDASCFNVVFVDEV